MSIFILASLRVIDSWVVELKVIGHQPTALLNDYKTSLAFSYIMTVVVVRGFVRFLLRSV
ncbi:hypothetical protein [Marinomonas primoryensis]|uniref:hypothetical protein n=1 Tax=Marinomonas primoryensis TaxID=178399 RepID=UPI001593E0DD|nr:hypothetical protein [Marinomonas primoryensis]